MSNKSYKDITQNLNQYLSKMRKEIQEVSVLPSQVTLKIDNKIFVAPMPKEGKSFIKRFDRGLAVNPFELNLKFKKGYALV